jgi:hypothetical protein
VESWSQGLGGVSGGEQVSEDMGGQVAQPAEDVASIERRDDRAGMRRGSERRELFPARDLTGGRDYGRDLLPARIR